MGTLVQSCKNVQTVRTSRCYFFWPVLIFGKSTRKTGENTQKQAKTRENRRILVLIFLGEKLVGANFYAFCNYVSRCAQSAGAQFATAQKSMGPNFLPNLHEARYAKAQFA